MKGPFLMRRSLAFGLVNETGRDEDETDDDEAEFWGGRANVRDSNGERGETTLSWVCFCYYLKFLDIVIRDGVITAVCVLATCQVCR